VGIPGVDYVSSNTCWCDLLPLNGSGGHRCKLLSHPEEVPNDDLDPVILIRPGQALAAIQTLKDCEEQQDDSSQQVVRQLKGLEKRVRTSQLSQIRSKAP
jgi:hypothetical protein